MRFIMDALTLPALFADYVATPEFMSAMLDSTITFASGIATIIGWTNHRLTSGTVCAQWFWPDFAD